MLVLARYVGQRIWLQLPDGNEVWITVVALEGEGRLRRVRLAFDAPSAVTIDRAEARSKKTLPTEGVKS